MLKYIPSKRFVHAAVGEVIRPGETWEDTRGNRWFALMEEDNGRGYEVRMLRLTADGQLVNGLGRKSKKVYGNPPPQGWKCPYYAQVPSQAAEDADPKDVQYARARSAVDKQ